MINPINIHKTKYFNSTISIVLIAYNLFRVDVIVAGNRDVIDRLKADVTYLCSSELAGRNVPGPMGDSTAHWLVQRFREINIQPAMGDTSFLQTVPLVEALLDTDITSLTISGSDWIQEFWWGEDFYIFPKRVASIDTILNASFCGDGIVSEDLGRDDFGKTAANTAAVVLPHGPREAGRQRLAPFKAAAAQRAGAKMLLIAYPIWNGHSWPPNDLDDKIEAVRHYRSDLPNAIPSFPVIYLNGYLMTRHIAGGDPYQEWEDDPEFARAISEVDVTLKVDYCNRRIAHGYNVIGKIDGTVDEYVIVGAHYDHLGIVTESETSDSSVASTGQMSYFPGADDNASGVAGLLEICHRWAERDITGRGLIAVAFTAEEDGMLGSQWFVDNLPVPREAVTAMVNLDMIGRRGFANMRDVYRGDAEPDPKYAGAYFSAASPKLRDVLRAASDYVDLNVELQPVNSFSHFGDAGPFHEAQVPTVHLFSGFHNDYHTPNDTIDKLDFEKMSLMVDLADALLVNLSHESDRIDFNPEIKVDKPHIPH